LVWDSASQPTDHTMTIQYWLVKSEPAAYSWRDLCRERRTSWTGVRNYQARNNLQGMRRGDRVLFYESVTTKAVLGEATVTRAAFPDPTSPRGETAWVAVELEAGAEFAEPVTLKQIKAQPELAEIGLLRQGRLSVTSLRPVEFRTLLRLGRPSSARARP